ncbi:MAG: serine hydrolase domain-containing protein [Pirellulales bacterium]
MLLAMTACVGLVLMIAAGRPGQAGTTPPPSIPAVAQQVRQSIEANDVAGAVTLVATPGGIVHLDVAGWADLAARKPMQADTIFWIASMTKPVTATAVLMLQEQGKLSVDDAVEKFLPEFSQLQTKDGEPARITIKHLLTHTSGLAEISADQARGRKSLAELIPLYVAQPVQFAPGTKWVYCQSSINTAARIVEVASGQPFVEFLGQQLFAPLGMTDTTFYLSSEQLPRLAKSYRKTEENTLEEAENFILLGHSPTSRERFPAANGGLFSTAPDYSRFCQMILGGGRLDGKRYLRPESVELMTGLQTEELKTGFTPGNGWGLGWCVVREPQGVSEALSPGSFGHGGAYGTQAWIDPVKKRIYILMVQRANFPNADASDLRRRFQEAAAAFR